MKNGNFYNGDSLFRFHGINVYYLYHLISYKQPELIDSIFSELKKLKVKVIRINAHYESDSINDNAVIMYSPFQYNEKAFESLDYLLSKAGEYNFKIIPVLGDNWNYYGGIDKYINWANKLLNNNFSHNSFFTNDSIKNWYKDFIKKLILRKNIYTQKYYYEDKNIFSWELLNEPRTSNTNGDLIFQWSKEMSEFVKAIDKNHLVGIGEEGFDNRKDIYSNTEFFYENNQLLFNGYYGISYSKNCTIKSLDYASVHAYPSGYGFNLLANYQWMIDHLKIAISYNKPLLIGEYGFKNNSDFEMERTLNIFSNNKEISGIYWQYSYQNLNYKDDFSINLIDKKEICLKILRLCENLEDLIDSTEDVSFKVFQNYPNPFRNTTILEIHLLKENILTLQLFDIYGKSKNIMKNIRLNKGINEFVLDLNPKEFSSGVYFLRYDFSGKIIIKKLIILK